MRSHPSPPRGAHRRGEGEHACIHTRPICSHRYAQRELMGDGSLRYVNGYDDPEVIAGTGTIGIEMLEQV